MFSHELELSSESLHGITYALKTSAIYEGDMYELWKDTREYQRNRCLQEIRRQTKAAKELVTQTISKEMGKAQARSMCESFRQGRRQRRSKRW